MGRLEMSPFDELDLIAKSACIAATKGPIEAEIILHRRSENEAQKASINLLPPPIGSPAVWPAEIAKGRED